MTGTAPTCDGLWFLVIVSSAIFILFAFFFKLQTSATGAPSAPSRRFWRPCSPRCTAFPLTIYFFLSGRLPSGYSEVDWLSNFLPQWPTILTLLMFPVLVYIYVRLVRSEKAEASKAFGELACTMRQSRRRFSAPRADGDTNRMRRGSQAAFP